jgi:hypothetical protein
MVEVLVLPVRRLLQHGRTAAGPILFVKENFATH